MVAYENQKFTDQIHASVAQWITHLPSKQGTVGSIPTGGIQHECEQQYNSFYYDFSSTPVNRELLGRSHKMDGSNPS